MTEGLFFFPPQLKAFQLTLNKVGRKCTQTSDLQAGHNRTSAVVHLEPWLLALTLPLRFDPSDRTRRPFLFFLCFSTILYLDSGHERTDEMGAAPPHRTVTPPT